VFWLLQTTYIAAFLCAALGVRRLAADRDLRLLLVHAAVFTALVATMVSTTRFRVPFAFPLAIASAAGLDLLITRRCRRADWIALAVAAGVIAFSFSRPLFTTLASGNFEQVRELARWPWRFFRY
jgi:hypothetical protein